MYTLQMCKESYDVYIFSFGANFKTQYDPNYLLKECVVTFTLNYLTSIFGFVSTQDEIATGNSDCDIQSWFNGGCSCIKTFGSDSENVILFGEIVGFTSVSLLFMMKGLQAILGERCLLAKLIKESLYSIFPSIFFIVSEDTKGLHHRVILENEVSSSLLLRTKKPLSRRNL
ncbi:hypothetical protein HHI36_021389 [Cryptolaemus montrouzieri]|uniref:Carboxylesterase type B domain-containing protein n=1 Tax=Cryptolaemus montrouzieri TaxID=559131 RepID=A0ABD2MY00_9CUCU